MPAPGRAVPRQAGPPQTGRATERADAAQRQLTKKRPGLLFAGLHGIEANELLSLAKQDFDATKGPTALRVGVSNFLSNPDRDHVVGVGFLSRGRTEIASGNESNSGGTAYIFPKRESRFWQEVFSGLFGNIPV